MSRNMPQILILEDDELRLTRLKEWIERVFKNKIEILTATNAGEAEGQLEAHGSTLDLFLTDVMMPGPDGKPVPAGLDLANRMAPRMSVIVMSAHSPDSFDRDPDRLGSITFLQKSSSKEFQQQLIETVQNAIITKQFDDRTRAEPHELHSLCLDWRDGAILTVRFRLPDIAPADLSTLDLRNVDYRAIGFGVREWQKSIEDAGGRIHTFHDQSFWASFADTGDGQEGVQRAVESFVTTRAATVGESKAGFEQCPFGAAVVPGKLVSGLFGRHAPGLSAIVGRLGDVSAQMALRARPGEIGVVREWLVPKRKRWFDRLSGSFRSDPSLLLANLTESVEVTFYRP